MLQSIFQPVTIRKDILKIQRTIAIKKYFQNVLKLLKMEDIDNNKLMKLLIIAGEDFLLSQKHIKERRKRRQWCVLGQIVNVHYAYNHSAKKHWQPILYFYSIHIKIKMMCFYFFYTVQVDNVYQKFFTTHAWFCFCVMKLRKQRNIFCTSEASQPFTQKNNFCIMNKIKLV